MALIFVRIQALGQLGRLQLAAPPGHFDIGLAECRGNIPLLRLRLSDEDQALSRTGRNAQAAADATVRIEADPSLRVPPQRVHRTARQADPAVLAFASIEGGAERRGDELRRTRVLLDRPQDPAAAAAAHADVGDPFGVARLEDQSFRIRPLENGQRLLAVDPPAHPVLLVIIDPPAHDQAGVFELAATFAHHRPLAAADAGGDEEAVLGADHFLGHLMGQDLAADGDGLHDGDDPELGRSFPGPFRHQGVHVLVHVLGRARGRDD